jgi:hypothetical protein
MKLTLVILSLLVGSFAQANQSQGNCRPEQTRVLSCSRGNFSVDLCSGGGAASTLATSDGDVYNNAIRKQNRADNIVYGTVDTRIEIILSTRSGPGTIQTADNRQLSATCQWHNYNMD